jgi:nucleoside-diphosphate-sugar epimerase
MGSRVMSEGLLNLLEASVKYEVRKFIYISSSMVYGDFTDDVTEDYNCKSQGQYGIMKLAGEWLVKDVAVETTWSIQSFVR